MPIVKVKVETYHLECDHCGKTENAHHVKQLEIKTSWMYRDAHGNMFPCVKNEIWCTDCSKKFFDFYEKL